MSNSRFDKTLDNKSLDTIDPSLFEFASYDEGGAEKTGYSNYSYWQSTFQVFLKNKVAVALLIIITVLVAYTVLQPYLPGQKLPTKIYNNPATGIQLRNHAPDKEFWFELIL